MEYVVHGVVATGASAFYPGNTPTTSPVSIHLPLPTPGVHDSNGSDDKDAIIDPVLQVKSKTSFSSSDSSQANSGLNDEITDKIEVHHSSYHILSILI
jgi:hypothetical protein